MPQPTPPKDRPTAPPLARLRLVSSGPGGDASSAAASDDSATPWPPPPPAYAELHCRSNFSFLVGASHPGELVARAAQLGYEALAVTDECSVAGVVRAHEEWKRQRDAGSALRLIIGSRFEVDGDGDGDGEGDSATPGCRLVLLARNREGYGDLCELITLGRLRAGKGGYRLSVRDLDTLPSDPTAPGHCRRAHGLPDCWALLIPRRDDDLATLLAQAEWLRDSFAHAAVAVERLMWADDSRLIERLDAVAAATGLPLVASGDVLMHVRSRKPLQDTLTAVRLGVPLADCGLALARNAEQHLRAPARLAQLYRPEWLTASVRIATDCRFDLGELGYEYPEEIVPPGRSAIGHLRALGVAGLQWRYPEGVPAAVRAQVERELALVEEKRYERFFLTVHDVVRHARSIGILCQGRGSAANSALCYALGITEVDPTQTTLLFERFISRERDEAPDIDVDFEHERREEVIQYIYAKYGTERCALAAALSTYRSRGAVRDVGKALGFDAPAIDALAGSIQWFDKPERLAQGLAEAGLDASAPGVVRWRELVGQLRGFPRHLSQHVGGFVIAAGKLSRLVPIENAAMADRRVIQWDKDDLEALGLLKVDVLALGMLTALRRSFELLSRWHGRPWTMHEVPREDAATYRMISRADTVGVFQIESRAQMTMLPRLKPSTFYDLVIEVAIVRPGPIQGGMVHPYLRRRAKLEPATSPKPELDVALRRTLGVPIFQEQVMQICMIAAGFSGGEADQLRRAMAAWKRHGDLGRFRERILQGMAANGYDEAFAEQIFEQISGFGDYGFPESHAYSFALLAYVSAWLKCHQPAAFLAALLNSQPMGFYGPSQLVQDATRHGVEVRPVDVTASDVDCTLEAAGESAGKATAFADADADDRADIIARAAAGPAVRLGLRMISGLAGDAAARIAAARAERPFIDLADLARRALLGRRELHTLARADALQSLAGHRRAQWWASAGLRDDIAGGDATATTVNPAPEGEAVLLDYVATGLSLRRHPLALLRERLRRDGWASAAQLAQAPNGRVVRACGIVTMRQHPETAKGVIFVTLEDESGSVNLIVQRRVQQAQRRELLQSRLLGAIGDWQISPEGVSHLLVRRLVDLTPWLGALPTVSRDFH